MGTFPSTTQLSAQHYVDRARVLLQDTVDSPYRYSTADLINTLGVGLREMRRLRPDMFPGGVFYMPDGVDNSTTLIDIDPMYVMPLIMFIVGYAQLRDDEEVQDQRAAAFLGMFQAKLTGLA